MAKAGPRKAAEGGEELRSRLVDATVRVLARDGFAHASARAIAQAAGTVNGSIFYYFGSMDGLLAATASAGDVREPTNNSMTARPSSPSASARTTALNRAGHSMCA